MPQPRDQHTVERATAAAMGNMKHDGSHSGHAGTLCPTPLEAHPRLPFAGESEPRVTGLGVPNAGLILGGQERVIVGHLVGPAIHIREHIIQSVEQAEVPVLRVPAPVPAGSDHEDRGTAQPTPTASPSQLRPPGAAGPGQPVSGWSEPGRLGPGRVAGP